MHVHHLNWAAILVSAVSTMVIGFLWYSPLLFAKPWMREMGCDPGDQAKVEQMKRSAGPAYLGSFIASLLSAFVLALVFHWLRVADLRAGVITGFHVWLGFVATVQFTGALFAKQTMKLFAINTGYQLACYVAMSAILTAWR
jgi:predicted membrane-bound spermidine synthase